MDSQQAALAICGATVAYIWYKRYHAISISDVPGPKNPSWIYGTSAFPSIPMTFSHRIRNRTQVVVDNQGGHCRREEASGRPRSRSPLEWGAWGTLYLLGRNEVLALMISRRKNACGLPTPKPSTTSSKVPIVYTRNRTSLVNETQWSWIGVSSRSRVNCLSHLM